ncbi:hypothetical protein IIZ81_03615 [Candidatus Saccharibacteria bacterium]|nr:hypothetical protein [Candidatus Saccharibacteria bacterium]
MEKKKKYRLRWGRIIIALGLFIGIGLIPLHFIDINVNEAKTELAKDLLESSEDFPEQTKEVLRKAASDPKYASKNIHVWSNRGYGKPYDTYIGGGLNWMKNAHIVKGVGQETARIILADKTINSFLRLLVIFWYITPIIIIIWHFANKNKF